MIKFDFIIAQMLGAMLTGIVISADDPHANMKWNRFSTDPAFLASLRKRFGGEEDGANMSENIACRIFEDARN